MVSQKSDKRSSSAVVLGVAMVAFIAFAVVSLGMVVGTKQVLTGDTYMTTEAVPASWRTQGVAAAESGIEGKMSAGQSLAYVSYVRNVSDEPLYVTHLAAYLNEQGQRSGFMTTGDSSVQYSYTPEDESSWENLELSAPGNSDEAFKLKVKLLLDVAGNKYDTLYVRYGILPQKSSGVMDDKMSFLVADVNGNSGLVKTQSMLAYDNLNSETPVAESVIAVTNGDMEYVKPLGVTDYMPETVGLTAASLDQGGFNILRFGGWAIIGVLVVILIGALAYLPLVRRK